MRKMLKFKETFNLKYKIGFNRTDKLMRKIKNKEEN